MTELTPHRRTIVIGDVHGCLDELATLVERSGYAPFEDRLVLLGDLLDRGPDPVGCVRFARELGAECILGNHEETHLRYRKHELRRRADPSYVNPMRPLSAVRMREHEALREADWEYLARCPTVLELDHGFVGVHAGFLPGKGLAEQTDRARLRLRYVGADGKQLALDERDTGTMPGGTFWADLWDGGASVVHGHAVRSLDEPTFARRPDGAEVWSLDTGCVFGGRLTALVLERERPAHREVVQVRAKHEHVRLR